MLRSDGTSDIMKWILARSTGDESQIREQWGDIVASRSTVRVRQWLSMIVSLALMFAGLGLIGVPMALAGGASTILDVALAGTITGLAALVLTTLTGWLVRDETVAVRALVIGLTVAMVLVAMLLLALRLGEPETWHVIACVGGVVLILPSAFFTYNQGRDLLDPMGWVSAWERQMGPVLAALMREELAQMRAQTPVARPIIPWQHSGRREYLTGRQQPGGAGDVEVGVERPPVPEPLDLELADFLAEARSRGLSRDNDWLAPGRPRYHLPTTGRRVTRTVYDQLIERAVAQGYVRPGGDGTGHEWAMDPDEAYNEWASIVEDEWGDLLAEAA